MNFLSKIVPAWLGLLIVNAIAIPLIFNSNKAKESSSRIGLIIPKPINKVAKKPTKSEDLKINRDNYYKCLQNADIKICKSKHYWVD